MQTSIEISFLQNWINFYKIVYHKDVNLST